MQSLKRRFAYIQLSGSRTALRITAHIQISSLSLSLFVLYRFHSFGRMMAILFQRCHKGVEKIEN